VDCDELGRSAIVFSPHPDDETLGCGGALVKKRTLGAEVTVAFMTDGAASHRGFIPEEQLRQVRRREALSACATLGVAASSVRFFDFPDGRLAESHTEAVTRVHQLLANGPVDQVFMPYAQEDTADHRATHAIVSEALRRYGSKMVVYEYPVWFWHRWPWTSWAAEPSLRTGVAELRSSMVSIARLARDLRWFVPVGDVLDIKRAALNAHRTQTVRLNGNSQWPILSDVAAGEFLECLFRPYEVFRRYSL
jgi:LmbE family N-acetylglucosaminyl deacetylase